MSLIKKILFLKIARLFTASLIASFLFYTTAAAESVTIPANTRIYVKTDEFITGKRKTTRVGQIIRASVWRDVVIGGHIVIDAGTPVVVRVDSFRKAKIAGIKGKLTLGAYETMLFDGTPVQLGGGYHKEGRGRMTLSILLAVFVFVPLIFIPGKKAKLERGTVFDAYTDRRVTIPVPPGRTRAASSRTPMALFHSADVPGFTKPQRKIDLTSFAHQGFYVEVLYEEMEAVEKPKVFPFAIQVPVGSSGEFIIDKLNGEPIEAIKLSAVLTGTEEELEFWHAEVGIKKLAKKFKKGINTFEISTMIDGVRVAQEIVLDIQI